MKTATPLFLALLCFSTVGSRIQAVSPPPDGGYPGGNTAEGQNALQNTSSGGFNTGVGYFSLFANFAGSYNTALGAGALDLNTSNNNTAVGAAALLLNTTGTQNTAIGVDALVHNGFGNNNTAAGAFALFNVLGNNNIAIGYQAGSSITSGNNNIDIGNVGVASDSNTIRIGNPAIHGPIFIAGIEPMTPVPPIQAVLMNPATAQLGSADISSFGVVSTDPENTAVGDQALVSNTGKANTATGFRALFSNTSGSHNTATGSRTLEDNNGSFNDAIGTYALISNIGGSSNNAFGESALFANTTGNENTAIGDLALSSNVDGGVNVAVGGSALAENVHGSYNTIVGYSAGANVEGNDNIYIGATSADGVMNESGTIRIGDPTAVIACYIGGISGQTASNGAQVYIDANGKLGTMTSSVRFKDDIKPMDTASQSILGLRPVSFRYKKALDPEGLPQFGLVAEEVEKINPALVVHDANGQPYSVRYEAVNTMLLNEFLKEHDKVETLEATVATLVTAVKDQASEIQKLTAQVELGKPATTTARNDQ